MQQQPCPNLVAVVVLLLPLVGVRMMTKTSVSGLAVASRWLMPCASHRRKDVHSTVRQILHINEKNKTCRRTHRR
jgi:hypothetical protein